MMKIVKLTIENFMKLRAVEITPDGHMVTITGKNAVGKSAALDSIWAVLEWAQASKKIKKPIREGQTRADIRIDWDEFVATRTFTAKGTVLKVTNRDGATYPSPQAFLDKFKTSISFDAMDFTKRSGAEQAAILRDLVGIDTTDLDGKREELYTTRANWNRQEKEKAGALVGHAGSGPYPSDTPDEEISVAELMEELAAEEERAEQKNAKEKEISLLEVNVSSIDEKIALFEKEIGRIKVEIGGLSGHRQETVDRIITAENEFLAMPDAGIEDVKAQIANADNINGAVRDRKDYNSIESQRFEAESNADKLTAKMGKIDAEKKELVEKAEFPIAGLGFDDSGVTFGGVPFAQASSAEQLRVSLAMAMALNPKLRVIRITDGSLLDSESMKLIQKMVEDNDFQLWFEKVDETGTVGVYIEDGQVVEPPRCTICNAAIDTDGEWAECGRCLSMVCSAKCLMAHVCSESEG